MDGLFDLVIADFGDMRRAYRDSKHRSIQEGDEIVVETGIVVDGFEKTRGLVVCVETYVSEKSSIVKLAKLLCEQTELTEVGRWYQRRD